MDGASEDGDGDRQCGFQISCGTKKKRVPIGWLQCGNNAKCALLVLSAAYLFQGFLVNGLTNVIFSTLERRFNLRSSESGLIASSYDIGFCASSLIVAYFGGKGHKPMWMGWGVFIMGLGSILFCLPHFFAPTYTISDQATECSDAEASDCVESLRAYRGFFIVAQLLVGCAAAPVLALGPVYLDENVKQAYSSAYHGVLYASLFLGTGMGFFIGSALLRSFTNLGEATSATQVSVYWVGNWWLGFLVGGLVLVLLSLPTCLFPKQLPGSGEFQKQREMGTVNNADEPQTTSDECKNVLRTLLALVKNLTLIFVTLGGAMDVGLASSLAAFVPKYIEAMFGLSASDAALYFGIIVVCAAMFGNLLGGAIITKFKFTIRQMIHFSVSCSVVSFGFYFVFFYRCDVAAIAGVTKPFYGDSTIGCDSLCSGCSTLLYDPVCGADNNTYASYCDAGCKMHNDGFVNCSRVLASASVHSMEQATAKAGKCSLESCTGLAMFLGITGIFVFFGFLRAQPTLQITLRCVEFNQRAFAIGLQLLIMRILGSIPMPIIFGRVLDLACILWGKECGECGSCKTFSSAAMSNGMAATGACIKLLGLIFVVAMWIAYNKRENDKSSRAEESCGSTESNTNLRIKLENLEGHDNPTNVNEH